MDKPWSGLPEDKALPVLKRKHNIQVYPASRTSDDFLAMDDFSVVMILQYTCKTHILTM